MILVDTSIWISALRDGEGGEAQSLRRLLDDDRVALAAPVRIELLAGSAVRDQPRLRRVLSALPLWVPGESTWALIDSWLTPAVSAGERFGLGDLLIAATAAERDASVWTLDRDFERMSGLGFVRLHPTGSLRARYPPPIRTSPKTPARKAGTIRRTSSRPTAPSRRA